MPRYESGRTTRARAGSAASSASLHARAAEAPGGLAAHDEPRERPPHVRLRLEPTERRRDVLLTGLARGASRPNAAAHGCVLLSATCAPPEQYSAVTTV